MNFERLQTRKHLNRNKTDFVIYRHLNSVKNSTIDFYSFLTFTVIGIVCSCVTLANCRRIPSKATNHSTSTFRVKNIFRNRKFVRKFYQNTLGHVPIKRNISLLIKAVLSLKSDASMRLVLDNPLLFADGRTRHGCQHASAASADWGYSSCRSADTQDADYRPATHSPVCVDRRTQTLHTRKTSRGLPATHNAGRRPQRSR